MDFTTKSAEISGGIEEVWQLVKGGGFKVGRHDFAKLDDVVGFTKTFGPGILWYQCIIDPLVMLGAISDLVAHQEDVQQREIHTTKMQRNANQSVVIAAF